MKAAERRKAIVARLMSEKEAIPGNALSEEFHVSRQIIVQDIALMRAENNGILSTNKGYLLRSSKTENTQPKRVFYVKHATEVVLDEFMTVLDLGGKILDVAVEHELYGQINVDLLIETKADALDFHNKMMGCANQPLKVLTGGCHYHTVSAPSEKLLDLIEAELLHKGYLQKE